MDEAEKIRIPGDKGADEIIGEPKVAFGVEELLGGEGAVAGDHEELAELGERERFVLRAEAGFEGEEGAEAGGGADEGDVGLPRLDGGRIEIEQVGVAGEEGGDADGEAEALPALLEVAERHCVTGLEKHLADDARAEAPALVAVDGAVEERVLAPGNLEAGDGGPASEEEPRRRPLEASAEVK